MTEPTTAAGPTETHPFVVSPYGPDRCRDCDHPESWHPARQQDHDCLMPSACGVTGFYCSNSRQQDASALREALPENWREQLSIINAAVQRPANAEQITLLDLTNKALRVLDAIEAALPPSARAGLDVERLERALAASEWNEQVSPPAAMWGYRGWAQRIVARLEQD